MAIFIFEIAKFFFKNYFHIAEIDSTIRGPWYTCLVSFIFAFSSYSLTKAPKHAPFAWYRCIELIFCEHQYASFLKSIKFSSGYNGMLRKVKNCTVRSKSWKVSKNVKKNFHGHGLWQMQILKTFAIQQSSMITNT